MVSERAFGSADFGATLRGADMHLKAWGGVVRLHGDSTSLYFGGNYYKQSTKYDKYRVEIDG